MPFESWFPSRHPEVRLEGALAVVRLAAEGGTVPFIARYRKEATGNLDEVAIRKVLAAKDRWDKILVRQAVIVDAIERQKKLTPELKETILATFDADALEDLYLPYKQKRKSRALVAREAGLEPLADWMWNCAHGTDTPQPGQTLELWAFTFRNEEKGVKDADAAILGARDILVERLAETPDLRQKVRTELFEKGVVASVKTDKAKPNSKYENYFAFHEKIASLREPQNSHRYLALRRGQHEQELQVSIGGPLDDAEFEDRLLRGFEAAAVTVPDSPGEHVLKKAARLALHDHVLPAIGNEVHRTLKDAADEAAIKVFAENVGRVLLGAPFGPRAVLGVDPGLRTGCKLAAVDAAGSYVKSDVIQLQSDEGKERGRRVLADVVREAKVEAVAVGNGTAGRETELFVKGALREAQADVPVVLVNEAGASVYSASDTAREEFPDLDVTVRGAISIARRLQDPLAELVKIEPKSIGVGQYQHDVSQRALERSLDEVVDSCVNQVGVNLNTASTHLLARVAGIGPALASAVVEHRSKEGLFRSRRQLLDVPRFSTKTFEQAAGFLRVPGAENPLDNTGVHPERYGALEGLAARLGKQVSDLVGPGVEAVRQAGAELREEVGAFTFDDIVRELEKPGRDPRETFVPFAFREDVHEIADLKPGMVCPGIVTNVTNFGAFVDVGVHQDGLVHLSQLGARFVNDPRQVVMPGDRVTVRVIKVNLEKKQISLTMRPPASDAKPPRPRKADAKRRGAERPRPAAPRPGPRRPATADAATGGPKAAARDDARRPAAAERPSGQRPPDRRPPDRRPGPRKERDAADAARKAGAPPRRADTAPPQRGGSRPAFNNPFAVLAKLKDQGKSGR
jgi:protein Tex